MRMKEEPDAGLEKSNHVYAMSVRDASPNTRVHATMPMKSQKSITMPYRFLLKSNKRHIL